MSSNILIAYFSHEGEGYVGGKIMPLKIGNTKVAARAVEKETGGMLFQIQTMEPYPYDYMETVNIAQTELQNNTRPPLKENILNIEEYDTIILGYPNWWGTMPMAVFHFLESHDFSGKTILPLCTHEGSGMGQSEIDIRKLCPDAKVEKGLAIVGANVQHAEKDIQKWLKAIGL